MILYNIILIISYIFIIYKTGKNVCVDRMEN